MKKILIVTDKGSWLEAHLSFFKAEFDALGFDCQIVFDYDDMLPASVVFFLSCTKICPKDKLEQNDLNLVVHASDLPRGKGFAPVSWQVLDGSNEITFSLLQAAESVDSGVIYLSKKVKLEGHELCDELRTIQANICYELCRDFLLLETIPIGQKQVGTSTYFKRRYPRDSELNINKSIKEQFNLLRIVDNERYPAFFVMNNIRYELKISKNLKVHNE